MKRHKFKDPRRGYDYKIKTGPMANKRKVAQYEPVRLSIFVPRYVETYVGGLFGGYFEKSPIGDSRPIWMQLIELVLCIIGFIICLGSVVFIWWLFWRFC